MENLILPILIVVLVIFLILLAFRRIRRASGSSESSRVAVLEERITGLQGAKQDLQKECEALRQEVNQQKKNVEDRNRAIANLEKQLAVLASKLESERNQNDEKIRLLKGAREEMANHFKVLSNSILEEKSRIFKEQNSSNLGELLNPLKERLGEFQRTIQKNYENEGKERHSLRNEVQKLMQMNDRLSQEAANLSNALKGETKTQGNWGEMILERILEVSGLRKGEEYSTQQSFSQEDGRRLQPDVIIHLPEERHMVIDSKVSLNAYEEYINSDLPDQQNQALKAHLTSLRSHIKGLSAKEYQKIHAENSPDFVIMFIPVEAAFMLAIAEDRKLWEEAWKANILMVSPSTLLFVLRIVMQLWRQEQRSQNAVEIARRGAALYDKLVGFIEDFDSIGSRLVQATKSFENARTKLISGKGNAIRQAQMLKELGITTSKRMPDGYEERKRKIEE